MSTLFGFYWIVLTGLLSSSSDGLALASCQPSSHNDTPQLISSTADVDVNQFARTAIVTVAKVGTTSLMETLPLYRNDSHEISISHSLLTFKQFVDGTCKTLFIVGVRDPVARDLSYFFQTFNDNLINALQMKTNNYTGEYCYIPSLGGKDVVNKEVQTTIATYFAANIHYVFNHWFEEFFEITKLNKTIFDKDKGLSIYHLSNDNALVMYTFERLAFNTDELLKMLKIPTLSNSNNSEEKWYAEYYKKVKQAIRYKKSFLDQLLDTYIMKFFYNEKQIEGFYSLYSLDNE
jgi:hypothetical protein